MQKSLQLMYAYSNLVEIWNTYCGSKGKYQNQFLGKSDQSSRPNFCYAYRVNHFEEQAEKSVVARLTIRGVLFGG